MPANFKTYESQARLLAAVIAAHPELKLNYKAISKAYGSTWSESGIEHYFRPLKKAASGLRELVEREQDTKDFNVLKIKVGSNSLFRGVKADAERLRQAASKGEDVSAVVVPSGGSGGGAQTPSSAVSTPKTGRKRAVPRSGTLTKSTGKRQTKKKKMDEDSDEDEGQGNVDYEALDSPTKDRGPKAWINRDESTWLPDPAERTPRAGNAAAGNNWPGQPVSSQSTPSDASATVTPSATFTAPSFSMGSASASQGGNGYSAPAPVRARNNDIKAEPLHLPLSFSFESQMEDEDDDYAV